MRHFISKLAAIHVQILDYRLVHAVPSSSRFHIYTVTRGLTLCIMETPKNVLWQTSE